MQVLLNFEQKNFGSNQNLEDARIAVSSSHYSDQSSLA